ncbi:mRNA-decapping enzyme 1A isoform X2 [Microcaecilia unicolor]|nr:mRNA-decapping enzyme 1A isoform X2 [Microcaecilia unicolor]XP_030062323.1 mRNA-decapping enzyme 1A isoform X2 [Microcaecilia unicolor]
MNRLNMHNLVEAVNKDLEFQLHEPFLLYRNASLSIYSIWFYDKNDCHRIAKLMAKVVEQEAGRAQQISQYRRSPSSTNGCSEERPIDILEMLSKAKDEYERSQFGDVSIVSSSVMQQNANCLKESLELSEPSSAALPVQDKAFQSGHKHLTVEELFGTSLPKEQPISAHLNSDSVEKRQPDSSSRGHSLLGSFSFEQSTAIHQPVGKTETPSVQSNVCCMTRHECVTPVLAAPTPVIQPDVQCISNYPVRLSPSLNLATTSSEAVPPNLSTSTNNKLMQVLQHSVRQVSPLMNQSATERNPVSQNRIDGKTEYMPTVVAPVSSIIPGSSLPSVDLLQKLRLTTQHDQIHHQSLGKAAIAPSFTSATGKLATPESFKETPVKASPSSLKVASLQSTQKCKEPEIFTQPKSLPKAIQVTPAQFLTTVTTVTPSVLLSPSVFQHSAPKSTELETKASSSPSPMAGATEGQNTVLPSAVLSRSQLQETLIHLIKNDSSFLSTLHEVYLQVLTKNVDNNQL